MAFRWPDIRSVLGFGGNLMGFNIFNYFARNTDQLVIGIFLGPAALGYYSLAYRLMTLPRDAVTSLVMRVLFPIFSRMQDDDERLAKSSLRVSGAVSLLTFPMMLGLAVVAEPFVQVVLGPKWLPAVPLICIFAPIGVLESLWPIAGQICLAKGRADLYFRLGVGGGLLFVSGFFVGLPWGIVGVASAYAVTCLFWVPTFFWFVFRLVQGLTLRRLCRTILPYARASGAMAVLVLICRWALFAFGASESLALALSVMMGAVTYATIVLAMRLPAMRDVVPLLPKTLGAHVQHLMLRPVD
jgi:O-antigen/teichoic acid export membrane protein